MIVNVHSAYREFSKATGPVDTVRLFAAMAAWRKGEAVRATCPACQGTGAAHSH
jgi:hypothetical protein